MKKKKGFTLIELLAVIVILAIIALIATPIVMNVIENSRKGAAERSAENYISAIETAIVTGKMEKGRFLSDGVYTLSDLEAMLGPIEVSGKKATDASIILKAGQVVDGSSFTINGYGVNIMDGTTKMVNFKTVVDLLYRGSDEKTVADYIKDQNEIIYNPVTQKRCTSIDFKNNCIPWSVIEDKGSEYTYVTLIARFLVNTTEVKLTSWCGDATSCKKDGNLTNEYGPITAMNYLNSETTGWTVPVSLPTAKQLAGLVGANFDEGNSQISLNGTIYAGLNIWTSTPFPGTSDKVYAIRSGNLVRSQGFSVREQYTVFPVITVEKLTLTRY